MEAIEWYALSDERKGTGFTLFGGSWFDLALTRKSRRLLGCLYPWSGVSLNAFCHTLWQ